MKKHLHKGNALLCSAAIAAGMGLTGANRESGMMPAPPATIKTTMVSPMLRDMPSMQAVPMPEKAAELRKCLHDWRKSVDAQMPTPKAK